ncbi:MAG: fluoride efflux transporter CrcB [Alphaproteobacteria bacterium]|nr:MAG: fluoride efflux transporter CrcB [Alphaproteobacteria bacterium]
MTFLYVAIGGALGASLRYLVALNVAFPLGTLAVNVIGSFLMGLMVIMLASKGLDRFMPLVLTGMLGGFTTFSAFSLDTLQLYEAGRAGEAALYVLASVVLSLVAVFLAVWIARGIFG